MFSVLGHLKTQSFEFFFRPLEDSMQLHNMLVLRAVYLATFLCFAVGFDVSDHIFDQSWTSEVEYIETLSPSQLWHAFINTSIPVKTSLPALLEVQKRWTNEYLVSRFGDEIVQTEPDRENRTTDYCGLVRLGELVKCTAEDRRKTALLDIKYTLRDYIGNATAYPDEFDRYVISMLPTSMAEELPFLPGFSCGLKRRLDPLDVPADRMHSTQVHELNFWFSKGRTASTIHYDMNHQIMCQIDGQKEWRFWDLRTQNDKIPMWSGFYPKVQSSDDAPIDPLNVDLDKYPEFLHARWTNTTLYPGECLLIPSRHALHFVRGPPNERNIGFSVHVSPTDMHPSSPTYGCDDDASRLDHSDLGKFHVMWPFPGDVRESEFEQIRMGRAEWKTSAFLAVKQVYNGDTLEDAIDKLTGGQSKYSQKIANLIYQIEEETDLMKIFNFDVLWREVELYSE